MQGNENFKYRNIRLIKNTNKIQYIGDTHEYLNIPVNLKSNNRKNDFFIEILAMVQINVINLIEILEYSKIVFLVNLIMYVLIFI